MSNGLVLVKNEVMAKVYSLNFHLYTDMNCLHYSSINAVDNFKELVPYLDVIIIDPKIDGDDLISQLDQLYTEKGISIQTIVLSRIEQETQNDCFTYLKDLSIKTIIKKVSNVLDVNAQEMAAKVLPDRMPLHINYFKDLTSAPCDIFAREVDGEEYSYHQIYEKGEPVEMARISSLQIDEKKCRLFIPKLERLKFVNQYTSQLTKSAQNFIQEDAPKKLLKDKQTFLQMSRDNIASIIASNEGMDEIMDIADSSIEECLHEVEGQGNKKLNKFITELFNSTDSYYLQHAQLTSYISFKMLKELNWLSMSQKKTFVSACFFRNILLNSDQEELAKIRDDETLDNLKRENQINQDEYNLIRTLPQKTVGVLSSFKKQVFPENTLTIIREQYGNKTGVGFKREGEKTLHSLSIAYIVANAYADKILLEELDDEDIIISELERDFEGQSKFLSYIELLKS